MKFNSVLARVGSWIGSITPALVMAKVASAQAVPPGPGPINPTPPITTLTGVTGYMCYIIGWIFTFFIILAVIFILVAACQYLTSGGDPEKATKAKNTLLYAVIAIVVALVAKGIPAIVASLFSVQGFTGCS